MRYQQNSQNAHPWADGQTSYDARIVEIGRLERADGVLNGPEKKTVWTMQCEWIGQFSTPPHSSQNTRPILTDWQTGYSPGPILSVFPALIVHSELKSVHPGFPVAFIFKAQVN